MSTYASSGCQSVSTSLRHCLSIRAKHCFVGRKRSRKFVVQRSKSGFCSVVRPCNNTNAVTQLLALGRKESFPFCYGIRGFVSGFHGPKKCSKQNTRKMKPQLFSSFFLKKSSFTIPMNVLAPRIYEQPPNRSRCMHEIKA